MNNDKLFEFLLTKTYLKGTHIRVFNYQVPAQSRDEALIKIGQTFNNTDEYTISVTTGSECVKQNAVPFKQI